MPRTPFSRTLFALLPLAGAALAVAASAMGWPTLLSLLAMATITAACAVIYWSAPLTYSAAPDWGAVFHWPQQGLPVDLSSALPSPTPVKELAEPALLSMPVEAAVESSVPAEPEAPLEVAPPPLSVGTRADQLAGEHVEQDLLTGLLAPEYFFSRFTAELTRCDISGHTAVLVICDLDQFGELNRTAGLIDANRLLRGVADQFRLTVREGDLLARLGADEFALFFPGLSPAIAEARVRDLRAAVREAALLVLEEDPHRVTISVGTGCFPRDGDTGEAVFEAADRALQAAKRTRAEQAGKPVPSAVVIARNPAGRAQLRSETL